MSSSCEKMYIFLILNYILFSCVLGATDDAKCDSKCYQTVNNSHADLLKLIERFNTTTSQANVSKVADLPKINKAVAQVKDVHSRLSKLNKTAQKVIPKLNETERNVNNDLKLVNSMLNKLSNIFLYNITADRILKEAKIHETNFEKLLEIGENASKTCQQARDKYSEFKKIIKDYNDVSKNFDDLSNKTKELNKIISYTFKETEEVKNEFDGLRLPENLMKKNFSKTIQDLRDNINLLKDLLDGSRNTWNATLDKRFKTVAKSVRDVGRDVNVISTELKKYEIALGKTNSFTPTVNDESRSLLYQIETNITRLKNDFKSIISEDEKKLLINSSKDDEKSISEIKYWLLLVKERKLLLDTLPQSEKELKKIRKGITDLRTKLDLLKQLNVTMNELSRLKNNTDEIKKINCTGVEGPSGLLQ